MNSVDRQVEVARTVLAVITLCCRHGVACSSGTWPIADLADDFTRGSFLAGERAVRLRRLRDLWNKPVTAWQLFGRVDPATTDVRLPAPRSAAELEVLEAEWEKHPPSVSGLFQEAAFRINAEVVGWPVVYRANDGRLASTWGGLPPWSVHITALLTVSGPLVFYDFAAATALTSPELIAQLEEKWLSAKHRGQDMRRWREKKQSCSPEDFNQDLAIALVDAKADPLKLRGTLEGAVAYRMAPEADGQNLEISRLDEGRTADPDSTPEQEVLRQDDLTFIKSLRPRLDPSDQKLIDAWLRDPDLSREARRLKYFPTASANDYRAAWERIRYQARKLKLAQNSP